MLKPLEDRVVLSVNDNKEEKTSSGIVIPIKEENLRSIRATVVEVGPGRLEDGKVTPIPLKKDDIVIIDKYCGTDVNYDDKTYKIVREADILAIVE